MDTLGMKMFKVGELVRELVRELESFWWVVINAMSCPGHGNYD